MWRHDDMMRGAGPSGPAPPHGEATERTERLPESDARPCAVIECLYCGRPRLAPLPPRPLSTGECRTCGYGGWAYAGEATASERKAIRDRIARMESFIEQTELRDAWGAGANVACRSSATPTKRAAGGDTNARSHYGDRPNDVGHLAVLAPRQCACGGRVVPRRVALREPVGGPAVLCACNSCGRRWALFLEHKP
jgi:hypothetical protein